MFVWVCAHERVSVHVNMCVHVCTCMCERVQICMRVCECVCVPLSMCVSMCVCVHVSVLACAPHPRRCLGPLGRTGLTGRLLSGTGWVQPRMNLVARGALSSFTVTRSRSFVLVWASPVSPLWGEGQVPPISFAAGPSPGLLAHLIVLLLPITPELLGADGAPRADAVAPEIAKAQWLVRAALMNEM